MAKAIYCWRCRADVPMLDEQEWERIVPQLQMAVREIQEHRRDAGVGLHDATAHTRGLGALSLYFEMTGFRETNVNAIWHHRLSLLGPPCASCGKPLRTPRAKLCAECGSAVER